MKTFSEFMLEASTTLRIIQRLGELIKKHKDDPEKVARYREMMKTANQKLNQKDPVDYPGRSAARRDKTLIPSGRTSSFPDAPNPSTVTKDPDKLKKQKALGEIK